MTGRLLAISDIHVAAQENRDLVNDLRSSSADDWLIVAGDVADTVDDIMWALGVLAKRFAKVVWVPGNHELWTPGSDQVRARGHNRYQLLVERCRSMGVVTPEDEYPVWDGPGGQVRVVPLFLLYDYSLRPRGMTKKQALDNAYEAGVVFTDERLLYPDPYATREDWCRARVAETERRLEGLTDDVPLVLVGHWPLHPEPTRILRHPEAAMWCGTVRTADWHRRFNVSAVVYGHLHLPRTTMIDGVRFEEVSFGYPDDRAEDWHPHNRWSAAGSRWGSPSPLRPIMPHSPADDIRW